MAQVIPLRSHTFRIDNCIIDDYGVALGIGGIAIYSVLQRYADRTTGQCWPSIATIGNKLGLSKNSVKKHLQHLSALGLISISPRANAEGSHTSHLYTVHDPTQTEAVRWRQKSRSSGARGRSYSDPGGASPGDPPPSHGDPGGTSPGDPEQALRLEQDLLTRSGTVNIEKQPCDHPGHRHSSPFPGLQMCIECFRHWSVPLTTSPPAADPARHQHA